MPPKINLSKLRGALESAYKRLASMLDEKVLAKEFEQTEALNPQTRFRLGDVEIDNPNLAYRQGTTGLVNDFLNTGIVRSEGMGDKRTIPTSRGRLLLLSKNFNNPMFQQGHQWYGVPKIGQVVDHPVQQDMLVTAEPLSIATKSSKAVNPDGVSGTFDVRGISTFNNGRRVPMDESQLNSSNTSAYIWNPSYGYEKVRPIEPAVQFSPYINIYERGVLEQPKPSNFELEWHAPQLPPKNPEANLELTSINKRNKPYNRQKAKKVVIPDDEPLETQINPVLEPIEYINPDNKPTIWDVLDKQTQDKLNQNFAINPRAYVPKGRMPRFVAVDENGNVDLRAVVDLKNKFYLMHPEARKYKQIINRNPNYFKSIVPNKAKQLNIGNYPDGAPIVVQTPSFTDRTNLFDHINGVVTTAQHSPTPKGATRQQFIESALFHDIGKTLDSNITHGHESVKIADELGIPLDSQVKKAIDKHMDLNLWDSDPLTKGLHFADVARGTSFEAAAWQYPHLMYPNQEMSFKPADLPFRDQVKIANKWLSAQGYETIPLVLNEEGAKAELVKRMQQHRAFLRGVRDPHKEGIYVNDEDMRNSKNADIGATAIYGESTPETRLRYSAEYFPIEPTGSGRSDLFSVDRRKLLPVYKHGYVSKGMGYDPNTKDALYASTSNDILNIYSTPTDGRPSAGYIVALPEVPFKEGESILEYIARNDFDMYDSNNVTVGADQQAPVGVWNQFVAPYLLQTGRSLRKDIMEKYKDEIPPLEFEKVERPFEINLDKKRFGDPMELAPQMLRVLGEESPYITKDVYKRIVNPELLKIYKYNDIVNNLARQGFTSPEGYPIWVNQEVPSFSYDIVSNQLHGFKALKSINTRMRQINHEIANIDKELAKLSKIPVGTPAYFQEFKKIGAKDLRAKKQDLVSEMNNLVYAANKYAVKHPDTYMVRPTEASLRAQQNFIYDPQRLADFMDEKGVSPRYQFPFVNQRVVIANEAPRKNVTKSKQPTMHHVEIVGDKGTKGFEVVEQVPVEKVKRLHRDEGERTTLPVTRKTLKRFGGKL